MEKETAMRRAGQVASAIQTKVAALANIGISLIEINNLIEHEIQNVGMRAAFKGYHGFPAASCISVNSAVVHTIPTQYKLKNGDLVSVDLGIENNGWIVDMARTYPVGKVLPRHMALIQTTARALDEAIKCCIVGSHIGDISETIMKVVETASFYVVRDLTGHGVGRELQENPPIPNFGKKGAGPILKVGQTIAIEPITTENETRIHRSSDSWTVLTDDHSVSAHFEDTILMTAKGPINLTRTTVENWPI